MSSKRDAELKNFFIFNSLFGSKEGEELKKILYYYPIADNADVQIKNVGLVEGIIQFTNTFKPNKPVNSLHTQKLRQLYFQPEKNYGIVMTLSLPFVVKGKDSSTPVEYIDSDVQDNVFEAILEQAYYTYRLFWNTFEHSIQSHDIGTLKTRLENFFKPYLKTLKLAHADILNVFGGIQYLPLDKLTFLKVQSFVHSLESNTPEIEQTAFLYNDHLIWSGLEPQDMKIVYQYLVGTLLPANMETELQGGSMPRNAASPFAALRHGRFITGPTNLKTAKNVGKIPKVYLFASGKAVTNYLVVYRALSATICFFMNVEKELTLQLFKEMDDYISPKLTSIVSEISEYCSKQVKTPLNVPENSPRFIYFNNLNLAYKSTVHLDNRHSGNLACSRESLKIMADMNNRRKFEGCNEMIVKTMNDSWVVVKNSNSREFYVALQQKNASLIDISEEVKKLCETELKGIFFHPI